MNNPIVTYTPNNIPDTVLIGVLGRATANFDMNKPLPEIRAEEKQLLSHLLDIPSTAIHFLSQVHEDSVITLRKNPEADYTVTGEADAILTLQENTALVIRTADCVPVMLYDSSTGAIAAIHSGWRSSRLNITGKTIALMNSNLNCSVENIQAWILPSIGPSSYQVGPEVAEHFPKTHTRRPEGLYLDLWQTIENQLLASGLQRSSITRSDICTLEHQDTFYSHRGGDAGRNLNFIMVAGK